MWSLLVVVSLVLPSALGGCCFPNRLSAVVFVAGELNPYNFLVDFKMNTYFIKPTSGDIQYVLGNMTNGNDYVRYKDGSCSYAPSRFPLRSCIPDTAGEAGAATLAGKTVKPYIMTRPNRRLTVVVTPDNCHPVMYMHTIDENLDTVVYTNVTTSVSDVSALKTYVGDCDPVNKMLELTP